MNITRHQSYIIGIGALALFFLSSILMLRGASLSKGSETSPKSIEYSQSGKPDSQVAINQSSEKNITSPLTLNKFHRSEIRDGNKLWEVSAEKGRYFPQTQSAELEDATLFLYREDSSTIQLKTVRASLVFNAATLVTAELQGNVIVTYSDKGVIKTEYALYDREGNSVTAPGHVIIENQSITIEGDQLAANLESKEFILKKKVSTVIQPRRPS